MTNRRFSELIPGDQFRLTADPSDPLYVRIDPWSAFLRAVDDHEKKMFALEVDDGVIRCIRPEQSVWPVNAQDAS